MIEPYFKGDIDYERHWGIADCKGKVVLDVGADIGSTASFFLNREATKVIAVEGNYELFKILQENAKVDPRIKPVYRLISSSEDWFYLLGLGADVAKIDCEYSELFLTGVPIEKIRQIQEYMIECHTTEIFRDILEKISSCNYEISVYMFHPEVFYARRKD